MVKVKRVSGIGRSRQSSKIAKAGARERNSGIFGLDPAKVEAQSKFNKRTNYGITFVAGYPLDGEVGKVLAVWDKEVSWITAGKSRLNTLSSHCTIGAIARSQDDPITSEDLNEIDFDMLVRAFKDPVRFKFSFVARKVFLGIGREGNIVLECDVEGDGMRRLQQTMLKAKMPLKWKQQEPGSKMKAFITLGHIDITTVDLLSQEQALALREWLSRHSQLDPCRYNVDKIYLVYHSKRLLEETARPDMIFDLNMPCGFTNGEELKNALLSQNPLKPG